MQFGDIADFVLVYCFNFIILGTAIWVGLRVIEKALDIWIKHEQLKEWQEGEK